MWWSLLSIRVLSTSKPSPVLFPKSQNDFRNKRENKHMICWFTRVSNNFWWVFISLLHHNDPWNEQVDKESKMDTSVKQLIIIRHKPVNLWHWPLLVVTLDWLLHWSSQNDLVDTLHRRISFYVSSVTLLLSLFWFPLPFFSMLLLLLDHNGVSYPLTISSWICSLTAGRSA